MRTHAAILTGAALALASSFSGCGGYASYPPIPSATPMNADPNAAPVPTLMRIALEYVTRRYPPRTAGAVAVGEPTFAINLPSGVSFDTYERIAAQVSDHARPLTRANGGVLPIYHIARVWVRGQTGTVDVLRPVPELGLGPNGQPIYRGITLHCTTRLEPWRVTRAVEMEIGVIPTPDLNYLDEPEGADEMILVPMDEIIIVEPEPAPVTPEPEPGPLESGTTVK